MTDEAQNVIVLKDAYDRWAESKGDSADHWTAIFADKIKFGSLAQGGYGAAYLTEYQSRDQLAQYFAGLKRDWEMIEYVAENYVAQGDRVVMLGHCSWRNRRYRQGGGDAEGGTPGDLPTARPSSSTSTTTPHNCATRWSDPATVRVLSRMRSH